MQRRPLEPLPTDTGNANNFVGRFLSRLFNAVDAEQPQTVLSQFRFPDFAEAFQYFGFWGSPVSPDEEFRMAKHPQQAINGDHPTHYLCWGVKCVSRKHCYFEIGDHVWILRADLKVNKHDQIDGEFVQLDALRIWDGVKCLSVNCADNYYDDFTEKLSDTIAKIVDCLDKNKTSEAKDVFKELKPFVQQLRDWEEAADQQLRQDVMVMRQRERGLGRNTP